MAQSPMRYVKVADTIYFRASDVVRYIREMAATEETDVRERFIKAAEGIAESVWEEEKIRPERQR